LTLRVFAADGLVFGGILDLDRAVMNTKLGAEVVSFDEHLLWLLGDDVTGEGRGLRRDRPDMKVVHIHHAGDLLESSKNSHVVDLWAMRGRGGEERERGVLTCAGTPSKRIDITRPSNEKVDLWRSTEESDRERETDSPDDETREEKGADRIQDLILRIDPDQETGDRHSDALNEVCDDVEVGGLDVDIRRLSSAAMIMMAIDRMVIDSGAIARGRAHEMGLLVVALVMAVVVVVIVVMSMVVVVPMVIMIVAVIFNISMLMIWVMAVAVTMTVIVKGSAMVFLWRVRAEDGGEGQEGRTMKTHERQILTRTPMHAMTNINFPSISSASPRYHIMVRSVASTINQKVNTQRLKIDKRAPKTSALARPNE
jgi:hypothetical protein